MPEVTRSDRRGSPDASLVGQAFYDIEHLRVYSFCPDSNDASTPAKHVHMEIAQKQHVLERKQRAPWVARFKGPDTLDALIEALIEHRTYVFGRREYRTDWPVQENS